MTIRLRAVATDGSTLQVLRSARQQLLAGALQVLHPHALQDASNVDAELADQTSRLLGQWLKQPCGYALDLLLESDQPLTPFAIERLGRDVFGKHPFFTRAVDGALPPVGGPQAVTRPLGSALPGLFAPTELLKLAGVQPEELPVHHLPLGPGADMGLTGRNQRVIVPNAWRASHMAVVGGSGTGKSTLPKRPLSQDIANGHGVALIDVDDSEFSVGLNPMEGTPGNARRQQYVAAALVEILEGLYETPASTGPTMRGHIRNSFLLAMGHPEGGTMHDAFRIHQDADFRDYLLSKASSSLRTDLRSLVESTGSDHGYKSWLPFLTTRLGVASGNPLLLRMLSRPSTVKRDVLMSQNAIVLFKISKGVLQNMAAEFLGSMTFLQLTMAAMARARLAPNERRPFFVYIDEFSVLATKSRPSAFRELRKFNIGLVVATQSWSSLRGRTDSNDLANEVRANTACKVLFRVSPKDAHMLDDYTLPRFNAAALTRTPNHRAVVSFAAQGAESFMVQVTPAQPPAEVMAAADLRRQSGQRHGTPIADINGYLAQRHDIEAAVFGAHP